MDTTCLYNQLLAGYLWGSPVSTDNYALLRNTWRHCYIRMPSYTLLRNTWRHCYINIVLHCWSVYYGAIRIICITVIPPLPPPSPPSPIPSPPLPSLPPSLQWHNEFIVLSSLSKALVYTLKSEVKLCSVVFTVTSREIKTSIYS